MQASAPPPTVRAALARTLANWYAHLATDTLRWQTGASSIQAGSRAMERSHELEISPTPSRDAVCDTVQRPRT